MVKPGYDWSSFTTRIPVHADPLALYRSWATRKGIEHWFLSFSEYKTPDGRILGPDEEVSPGDEYTWRWYGWSDDVAEQGTILDCNGKDYFKFTFGDAGICTVRIRSEQNIPLVELVQSEIPTHDTAMHQWHLGCKVGWTFYLTNLKSLMEGGIDLRNKNELITRVINS